MLAYSHSTSNTLLEFYTHKSINLTSNRGTFDPFLQMKKLNIKGKQVICLSPNKRNVSKQELETRSPNSSCILSVYLLPGIEEGAFNMSALAMYFPIIS